MNARERLIEAAENSYVSWETIARECLEEMSVDDCQDVECALGLDGEYADEIMLIIDSE